MVTIKGLFHDDDHVITESKGIFSVVEHQKDFSISVWMEKESVR